jgi:hypothetical protein
MKVVAGLFTRPSRRTRRKEESNFALIKECLIGMAWWSAGAAADIPAATRGHWLGKSNLGAVLIVEAICITGDNLSSGSQDGPSLNFIVVVSALCAEVEPQARLYTKLRHYPQEVP